LRLSSPATATIRGSTSTTFTSGATQPGSSSGISRVRDDGRNLYPLVTARGDQVEGAGLPRTGQGEGGNMSPRRKPKEQRTRYDLAHDHLKHHFENGTLPLAPPRDEQPADIVAISRRWWIGEGMRGVSVVDQRPSAAPTATGLGGVRVRVGTSPELPWGLSCRVRRSVAAPTGGTTLSAASSAGPSPRPDLRHRPDVALPARSV
jgi:hypothetical protein